MSVEAASGFTEQDDGQLSFDMEVDANIKPYYWVNQAKDIINAKHDLTLTERRLIYSLVSLIQPTDNSFKTYTLQVKEMANLLGVADGSFYERIEKTIDQLQSKQLVIQDDKKIQKNYMGPKRDLY